MEETGDLAVFMILLSRTGITTFITLIDGIVLHGALIDLSLMAFTLTMDMAIMVIHIFMEAVSGMAMVMPLIIPIEDHLIVLTTLDEMILVEIVLTVLLIEGKQLHLEWDELQSTLAPKETTTGHLLAQHMRTAEVVGNQIQPIL